MSLKQKFAGIRDGFREAAHETVSTNSHPHEAVVAIREQRSAETDEFAAITGEELGKVAINGVVTPDASYAAHAAAAERIAAQAQEPPEQRAA